MVRFLYRKVKNRFRDYLWFLKGLKIQANSLPANVKTILFICKGNIIRSVFAEQYTRSLNGQIRAWSAGVDARPGTPSPQTAIEVAGKFDIDLQEHRSKQILVGELSKTDMIICMEHWHADTLKKKHPDMADRIYLMSRFDPDNHNHAAYLRYNIPDPYGKSAEHFEQAFTRISACVKSLLANLKAR